MNFALSDEQEFLKEAARGALSRVNTVAAAREALDGGALPDLWPIAVEAGWPGLLVSEANGGAELSVLEAMLVFEELGRVLASVPLLGHLPASFLLDRAGAAAVEGRHQDAVGGPAGKDRLGQRAHRARVLHVDVQDGVRERVQDLLDAGYPVRVGHPDLGQLLPGQPADRDGPPRRSRQVGVVQHHGDAVCRGVHVGLEVAVPEVDGLLERRHRVLQAPGGPATVGEGERVRRVQEWIGGRAHVG